MQINLTLIVQAAQFMISYFFLYRFLFRPAYKILSEQDKVKADLQNQVIDQKNKVFGQDKENKARFLVIKGALFTSFPKLISQHFNTKKQAVGEVDSTSQNQLDDKQKKEVQSFLVDKLSDL